MGKKGALLNTGRMYLQLLLLPVTLSNERFTTLVLSVWLAYRVALPAMAFKACGTGFMAGRQKFCTYARAKDIQEMPAHVCRLKLY